VAGGVAIHPPDNRVSSITELGSTVRKRTPPYDTVLYIHGRLLCLALALGGGTYSWAPAAVLAPIVIGVVLSLGWILCELSMSSGFLM
jgi:hypothetical protein